MLVLISLSEYTSILNTNYVSRFTDSTPMFARGFGDVGEVVMAFSMLLLKYPYRACP